MQMIALYPLIVIYLLFSVYVLVGGWMGGVAPNEISKVGRRVLPLLTLLTLWLSGSTVWTLLVWLWPGERYLQAAPWFSGAIAVICANTLYLKMSNGLAGKRYVRICSWGCRICAGVLGAVYFLHFFEGIDGLTARGAAESKFTAVMRASELYPANLQREIVDDTTPRLAARGGKSYAAIIDNKRVAEVRVMPYYRWWWTVSYFRTFGKYDPDAAMPSIERVRRNPLLD